MQSLRIIKVTATQWGLPNAVPRLLCTACAERAPGQKTGQRYVGSDRALQAGPWPGADFGARPPEIDETPLSLDEVFVGLRDGVIA